MRGGCDWKSKSALLSQNGKVTQVVTFEKLGDMVHQLQRQVKKRRKKDLEKSASHTRSIKDMFLAQHNRNRLHHSGPLSTPLLPSFQLENSPHQVVKKVKAKFELQIQAVHDLGEPLHLKRDKYGHKLSSKSS